MMKTTFAFDYDNTISRDPDTMFGIMHQLRSFGHNVYIVSARRENIFPEDFNRAYEEGFEVIKTRHIAKRSYLREVLGLEVDVWVDDIPESITDNWEGAPRTFRDMKECPQSI